MQETPPIQIEMFYTITCANCTILKRKLKKVLPQYGNKFVYKQSLANSPIGFIRTCKLGIFAVPALLIDNKVVFRSVPTTEELIEKLNSY